MTINEKIHTVLTYKDVAILAAAAGSYEREAKVSESSRLEENLAHIKRLINRLGREVYSYPEFDFTEEE